MNKLNLKSAQKMNQWMFGIVIFTVVFLVVSVLFKTLDIGEFPTQVSGVLFEVVITAIITVLLLNGQSATEEKRDKSLLVLKRNKKFIITSWKI